jgi:hypothetical protein
MAILINMYAIMAKYFLFYKHLLYINRLLLVCILKKVVIKLFQFIVVN